MEHFEGWESGPPESRCRYECADCGRHGYHDDAHELEPERCVNCGGDRQFEKAADLLRDLCASRMIRERRASPVNCDICWLGRADHVYTFMHSDDPDEGIERRDICPECAGFVGYSLGLVPVDARSGS